MHQRKNWCECTKRKKKSTLWNESTGGNVIFGSILEQINWTLQFLNSKFESELFCLDKLYQVVAIQMNYSILL